ncbi:Glycoside hydrolase family 18, catalytic domain [Sesbania bispinosa]|nr:Glycoside hydrolase family 18, catalytic domain [Sesbania bispinosa]
MSLAVIVKPTIFREYIGAKSHPDNLHDFPDHIINPKIPEFHFILAFATEKYDNNGRGTGHFKRSWNVDDFSAEKIKKLKEKYETVKVVISIGGRGNEHPFNPADNHKWSESAIHSIKDIIKGYKNKGGHYGNLIDGIDINYEVINSNEADFSFCIGKVIHDLKKNDSTINVVSIAPSNHVRSHYKKLYLAHRNDIDWVGYQFYDQTVSSKDEFIKLYREVSNDYREKLLAGFSTDPQDAGKISREDFFEGCADLVNFALLAGIFVWDANDSAEITGSYEHPFMLEEKAQKLLTQSY